MKGIFKCRGLLVLTSTFFVMTGFTGCESCSRDIKTKVSDINGLNRQVTLMDFEGDTIKQWRGKLLISTDGAGGYLFDGDDNKRVMIKGGIVVIEEQ